MRAALSTLQCAFLIGLSVWLGLQSVLYFEASQQVTSAFLAASDLANLDRAVDSTWQAWAERLTLGLYSGATEHREALQNARQAAIEAEGLLRRHAAFLALSGGLAALVALLWARLRPRADVFVATLTIISLACLTLGVFTPTIVFTNERDLPVIGPVVTEAQIKSIWGAIAALYRSGNAPLAAILLIACMAIPVAKATLVLGVLWRRRRGLMNDRHDSMSPREHAVHDRLLAISKFIGRFSFLDLFVGAIMLSMFALQSVHGSIARSQPGIYLFAAYCVLSFIAGWLVAPSRSDGSTSTPPTTSTSASSPPPASAVNHPATGTAAGETATPPIPTRDTPRPTNCDSPPGTASIAPAPPRP